MPTINISSVFLLPFAFVAGLAIGALVGFFTHDRAVQVELRRRMEYEKYNAKPVNWLAESRKEPRKRLSGVMVSIKAPSLDSAGFVAVGEELIFSADVVDISHHGISILSLHFLKMDIDVLVACYEKRLSFPYRLAKVRNVTLTPKGLRIGMQFFQPLDNV